ncbi:hypothetical protein ABPG72_017663 [Tetrahymena utriculariae]
MANYQRFLDLQEHLQLNHGGISQKNTQNIQSNYYSTESQSFEIPFECKSYECKSYEIKQLQIDTNNEEFNKRIEQSELYKQFKEDQKSILEGLENLGCKLDCIIYGSENCILISGLHQQNKKLIAIKIVNDKNNQDEKQIHEQLNPQNSITSFVNNLEEIINSSMIQENIKQRKNCYEIYSQLHDHFIQIPEEFISEKLKKDHVDYYFEDIYQALAQAKDQIKNSGSPKDYQSLNNKNKQYIKRLIQELQDQKRFQKDQSKESIDKQVQEELQFFQERFQNLVFNSKQNNYFDMNFDETLNQMNYQNLKQRNQIKIEILLSNTSEQEKINQEWNKLQFSCENFEKILYPCQEEFEKIESSTSFKYINLLINKIIEQEALIYELNNSFIEYLLKYINAHQNRYLEQQMSICDINQLLLEQDYIQGIKSFLTQLKRCKTAEILCLLKQISIEDLKQLQNNLSKLQDRYKNKLSGLKVQNLAESSLFIMEFYNQIKQTILQQRQDNFDNDNQQIYQQEDSSDQFENNDLQVKINENKKVEFQMKKDQKVYEITNLNAFISKKKIEKICEQTFINIQQQNIQQGQKAKEFTPGGCSNRVSLNCYNGVFFIQKKCDRKQDAEKERKFIKILSNEGITFPLIERSEYDSEDLYVEQVAGVQSLNNIIENIYQKDYNKEKAFIPFVKCLIVQLFDKLRKMHEKGFAHSDIKPHNIVMGFDRYFYFIDFGASIEMQEKNKDYLNCYTKAFNTKWYLKNKPTNRKDIIRCDNCQLSLSIIRLLLDNKESQQLKQFNEKEETDFLNLVSIIFERFYSQSNDSENRDIVRILIFLFQFVFDPQISFNQVSKMIVEKINDNLEEKILNLEINPLSLQFESVFPFQEVIDMFSNIEEIEFLPDLGQIKIKSITIDNIRYIELLSELGFNIKCDDYLQIQYDQIQKYELLIEKAETKNNTKEESNIEIYNIYLMENSYLKILGHFQHESKNKEKYIFLNKDLDLENQNNNGQINQNQLIYALKRFLKEKITSFKDSMNNIKKKFESDDQRDFKNVFNSMIVQLPEKVELLHKKINEQNLCYLEQLIAFNKNLKYLNLDLSLIKNNESFKKLASILRSIKSKQNKYLILENIKSCHKQFLKKVLLKKWASLSFSLSSIINESDYKQIFSEENKFKAKVLEIIFSKKNIYFDNVCSDLLKICENVQELKLNFLQNGLQQQDSTFKKIFKKNQSNQISSKIGKLQIQLQRDESEKKKLNKYLIKYIKNQKSIKYFELEIQNTSIDEETVHDQMNEIINEKKSQNIKFQYKTKLNQLEDNLNFIKLNHNERNINPNMLLKQLDLNQNHLKEISLLNLELELSQLENIFERIFKCEIIQALNVQVVKILKGQIGQKNEKLQNQKDQLKHFSCLKLDFSKINILELNSNLVEQFLMLNPKQFKEFSIRFQEKNNQKNIKYPKQICQQQNLKFQADFLINPNFDDEDQQFENLQIDLFELKSDNLYYSVEFNITKSFKFSDKNDLDQKGKYIFANAFKNKIKNLKIIINQVDYSTCNQIKSALKDSFNQSKKQINKELEIFMGINSQDLQQIKQLLNDLILTESESFLFSITISNISIDILNTVFKYFKSKIIVNITDLDIEKFDYKKDFFILETLCNSQIKYKVNLVYTKKDLFDQVKQILGEENLKLINKIIKPEFEIKGQDFISLYENQNINSEIEKERKKNQEQGLTNKQNKQLGVKQFLMSQKDFSIFIPYYQFEYIQNGDLESMKISKYPDKFTLPLDKIDYLKKLAICMMDNVDLDEIIIDFSQQDLDLDSAQKMISLFEQKNNDIKSVTLNFYSAISLYKHEDALKKLDQISQNLDLMKNLENLTIYLDNNQFDKKFQIHNLKKLKKLQLQINSEISQDFLFETLDNVENHQSLENYKVFYIIAKQIECSFTSNEKLIILPQGNKLIIHNYYCVNQMHIKFSEKFQQNYKQISDKQDISNKFIIIFQKAEYISFQFLQKVFESIKKYFQQDMETKQFELNFEQSNICLGPIVEFCQKNINFRNIIKYTFQKNEYQQQFNESTIQSKI